MAAISLLLTALLFGGTVLFAFGFAAFVFNALPADTAGPLIRRAFPHFYVFVMSSAFLAAVFCFEISATLAGWLLLAIAASTLYARQILMPSINAATDAGETKKFHILHSISVGITLLHIAVAGYVLIALCRH